MALVHRDMFYTSECDDIAVPEQPWRVINEMTQEPDETEEDFDDRYMDWAFKVNDCARRFGTQYPKF